MGKCVYSNIPIKYSIGYNSGYDDGKYPKLAITGNKICEEYISLSYDDYKESVEHFENVTKSGKSNAILGKSIINLTNLYLDVMRRKWRVTFMLIILIQIMMM